MEIPIPAIQLAALILSTSLAVSGPALAHAMLRSATPSVGGTVQTAPSNVIIDYTEGIEPKFSTIQVQDAAGSRMDSGDVQTTPGDNKRLTVGLKPLRPGSYKVIWHVTSTDTHKTEGTFTFTVTQ